LYSGRTYYITILSILFSLIILDISSRILIIRAFTFLEAAATHPDFSNLPSYPMHQPDDLVEASIDNIFIYTNLLSLGVIILKIFIIVK